MTARPPPWKVLLILGRVSNLPTVWSNVLAGVVLAAPFSTHLRLRSVLLLGLAMSAYYVGGMFLNDYFDREIDARERAERPIPMGWIDASRVASIGYGLLVVGFALLTLESFLAAAGLYPLVAGLALIGAILLYDRWHKGNPLSPLIMGMCRVLVYVSSALASGGASSELGGAALSLLAYLIGLTYIAKHESGKVGLFGTWPLAMLAAPLGFGVAFGEFGFGVIVAAAAFGLLVHFAVARIRVQQIGPAVGLLIAGIALVDALFVAAFADGWWWLAAMAACALTILLQRRIAGT